MEINFPFFASDKGASYYCGRISKISKKDENILLIEIGKIRYLNSILYAPEMSPKGITTSFLDSLIRGCSSNEKDSGLNAIIVQHYVIHPSYGVSAARKSLEVQNIIIAYERGGDIEGVSKESSRHLYLNYFRTKIKPTKTKSTDTETKPINDGEELHVIIISNKQYIRDEKRQNRGNEYKVKVDKVKIVSKAEEINGEIAYYDAAPIKHIRTWPLIARVPMDIKIGDLSGISKNLTLVEVILLEVLLGSSVMIRKRFKKRQLPLLIPVPLLSRLHKRSRSSSPGRPSHIRTHLLALPSASYISVGGIMVIVDLSDLFDKLSDYLIAKIGKARELLESFEEKLVIQVNFKNCGIGRDQHINDVAIEAILKAITDNFVLAGQTIDFLPNIRRFEDEIRNKIRLPHRIVRLEVPIPSYNIGFSRLGLVNGSSGKHAYVYVAYDVVRERTKYLEGILLKIRELREKISSSGNRDLKGYDNISLLLAAFLSNVNGRIAEILEEKKISINDRASLVSIDACILARRTALLLLEYGLHALSHLLLKYLHTALNVPKGRLRELVALSLGEEYKHAIDPPDYYMNVAINGFRYRLLSSIDPNSIKGVIMITSDKPFTYKLWESFMKSFIPNPEAYLRDFIEYAFELLGKDPGSDRCLNLWSVEADKMRVRLKLYDAIVNNEISNAMEDLENLILVEGDRRMALPLLEVRSLAGKHWKEKGRQLGTLKPYLDAIYVASVPFCFDGCYNCVLVEKECPGNPLSNEWTVSKSIARLILEELLRGLSGGVS